MMPSPSLKRSKKFATIALIIAIILWLVFMLSAKFFPQYSTWLHILMLSAEAGVVGGFADWYAITVLFRNPFGKMPIPHFLRDHTEIIPRNKARIAESMGRFVQENFLSPQVVEKSLQKTDLSLSIGQWLENTQNSHQVTRVVQNTLPKFFDFVEQEQIAVFIQNNSVQWLQNTKIHSLASQMLRAVLDNDFHQDVLQHSLDTAHAWVVSHPKETRNITTKIFSELGIAKLSKGASWFGFDMQQRTIDSFLEQIEALLSNPEHPWRKYLEVYGQNLIIALNDEHSPESIRLNAGKNALLTSPQLLNFLSGAVVILCQALKNDLQKDDSGVALNIQAAIKLLGHNLIENQEVRLLFNQQMSQLAISFSDQYSAKVIRFVSERIHEWDSSEMINKIENEVGSDLHMIRVNGVVVGAFIGLILGLIRAVVELI